MHRIVLPDIKNLQEIDVYLANEGYYGARLAFQKSPDDIIEIVKKSGLRG